MNFITSIGRLILCQYSSSFSSIVELNSSSLGAGVTGRAVVNKSILGGSALLIVDV